MEEKPRRWYTAMREAIEAYRETGKAHTVMPDLSVREGYHLVTGKDNLAMTDQGILPPISLI